MYEKYNKWGYCDYESDYFDLYKKLIKEKEDEPVKKVSVKKVSMPKTKINPLLLLVA
jgi:hypothetical protein